ncbi:MAG: hypothetical protein ACOY5B_11140 [Spirochaetota bacterium]
MIRRYFVSLAAVLLATIAFFAENQLVKFRSAELTERRFDALEETIALIDRKVGEKNDQGEFFRYLGARPGKDPDLAELNPAPKSVLTAVLLDRDFRALARSGRDLTDEERSLVRSGRRSAVAKQGILRTYILTDFSSRGIAYLVLLLTPGSPDSNAALYVATLDFQTVTGLDSETFGREDNLLLGALLSRQAGAREVFRLHGTSYLSVRRYLLQDNMVLFQLTALPPIYAFFSLYLLTAVILLAAVWLLRGFQESRFTRRELSERILHSYGKAIDAHASALGELSRLTQQDDLIREKLIVGDARQSDIEARIRAEREAQKQREYRPNPIVIDIMPEERQFRFMNPVRTVSPSGSAVQLGVREQKLRERAFSDELRSLMATMGGRGEEAPVQPVTDGQLAASISRFEAQYHFPEIDQYLFYLNELYFDEVTGEELAQAMRVAGDAVQSHEFAILLYDAAAAAFRCGFVQGVPAELVRTLYLLPKDSVIPNDFADYGYVETTAVLRKNSFFAKRFPTGFSENLKGIHVFPLSESFLRARILFFDTARGGALSDPEMVTTVRSYLRQVAPALHMFFSDTADTAVNPHDLAEWAVRELRECIVLSAPEHPLLVSQYVFENSLAADQQLALVREITRVLTDGEKVLVLSPSRIAVAHAAGSGRAIESLVGVQGKKFIIKESEFGKSSRNLYTFIEF